MVDERNTEFSLFLGNVAPNSQLPAQQMKLSTDGPFVLREIAVTGAGGQLIPSLTIKFQDARGAFLEQDFISSLQEVAYGGNDSVLTPIVPQVIYPPNGNIVFYISNTNPSVTATSLRVVFRGVTLFPLGAVLNRQRYPKYFREIPYIYEQSPTMTVAPTLNNILNIQPDSAFALRALLIAQQGPGFQSFVGSDFQIALKDVNGKYYEIPAQQGTLIGGPTYNGVFVNTIAGETTANRPGILVPEIYLEPNASLYYDLNGPSGSLPLTLWIAFIGAKIFLSNQP
jgi:hypothetical protein